MPSGLPSVSQSFDADTSGYIAGIAKMIKGNEDLIASIAKVKSEIAGLGTALAALPDRRVKVEVTGIDEALGKVGALRSALDGLGDKHISVGGDNGEMVRHLQDISTYMDIATDSMGRMEDHMVAISKNTGDSTTVLAAQTQALRDNADAHTAAAAAVSALSSAHQNSGGGGWGAAAAAAAGGAAGGGGGGGGRGRWTAGGYASAGGGASFPVGSAGHDASVVTGFVKRWWTPVHFAVMTANELMATMLPAAAAAGAATLVGWQGAEQMIPRIKAINAAAESLGPAYGITTGSYLGTGSAIQRYQNLASGGVYELGGAGINLARSGAGGFGQTGLNTIAMLDRGVADMQINMKQRGTMGLLQGLAGGGTDYLRQFGDIGANFGNILLGLAPHLPGVGGDYLSTLEGATGGIAGGIGFLNQHGLGNLLGAGMAGEAGWRIGKPVVGLAGKGLMGLGNIAGKLGLGGAGLAEGDLADIAALTGMDLGEGAIGLGGGGLAGLLTSGGMGLGMLGGPEVAGLALSAFLGTKLVGSMPTGAMRRVSGLQAGIGQAGFTGAWAPLAKAITTTTGLGATSPGGLAGLRQVETPYEIGRFGPGITPTYADTYKSAAQGFTGQLGNLVGAGPQLVADLKKAGLKSVNMADAFQIAQNSLLDLSHAFDKHGNLTKQAQQMLTNYVSAIGPMTRSGGAFNAAVGAQQIMSSPAMQNLSKVNQAMDSMTQIMTGGPAGMAGLMTMIGGAHPAGKPPAAMTAIGHALTSFTTAGGAAAWSKFAGPSGMVSAEQQNLDQLRTYMTLGAMGPKQAAGVAGFQIQQLLPMAKQSPAALAMLMQQGQQMGIGGYYDPSKSQAQNYQAAVQAFGKMADSSRQVNKDMNAAVVATSNIPAVAKQFVQGTGAHIQAQQVAKAAQDAMNIKGGINIKANVGDLVGQLRAAGVQGAAALKASVDAVLKQAGVGKAERIKIEAQVTGLSQAQSQLNALKDKQIHAKVNVDGAGQLKSLESQIAALKGKNVTAAARAQGAGAVAALAAAIAALRSKEVTITTRMITIGGMAGVTQGIPVGVRAPGMQTGGMVPGSGHGDIIPAMLEPGEAIIPRYLVPLIAPILAAHRVPGFGGMPQSSSSHFAAGGVAGGGMSHNALLTSYAHALGIAPSALGAHAGSQFAVTIMREIADAVKNSAGAKKIADALVAKIGKEVALAKNVSSAAMKGQGFGDSGMFGSMDVTPGTGGGTVQEQMQSYLGSVKSFTKDIGMLRKGHLNKAIISQLVAAGPVQGDALAQSIMNDYGGIKGVNSLWGQLGHATKGLGAQAAMAQYGGTLSPNLQHAGVSIGGISISINAGGGATLSLSDAQIKAVVAKVQAALLKQARRNNKTGLQLPTKGA